MIMFVEIFDSFSLFFCE